MVLEQVRELQGQHPGFELQVDPDAKWYVRGEVGFAMGPPDRTVVDRYRLELLLPADYPDFPPVVFETENKIPRSFDHFMKAGNLCLEAPVEVRRRFAEHRNLLRFVNELVVPYLFAVSYKERYGELPLPDRSHHTGLMDYYAEFFSTSPMSALKLLKCLADDRAPPLMRCPCRSGTRLAECHGPRLEELRPHLTPRQFEAELRQIVKLAETCGLKLPESVFTTRMLRQRRRDRKRRLKT